MVHIMDLKNIKRERIKEYAEKYGTKENGFINYVDGANIGGFEKVANAMIAQGVV